jgi:uncharacterized YigZ family protein
MDDTYLTIAKTAQGIFKDKGSKFLAFAHPVSTEEEIQRILDKTHRDYYDARHHCFAWRLGADSQKFRANDDGEPSGTAGLPILNQIKSKNLTNVLVIVVRYFGGILLGTSGLTNAYKTAAQSVLDDAEIITKTVNIIYKINFGYLVMNDIMKVIKDEKPEILEQNFDQECYMLLSIRQGQSESLENRLQKIEGTTLTKE